jgi:hypothetical protein
VTWFDQSHITESIVTQLGCLKAGVTIVPVVGNNSDSFFSALSEQGVKGAVISPNGRVDGNQKKSEVLSANIPELNSAYLGQSVNSSSYPELDLIVQTGFYSIPGTFKYKDVLTYANPNFLDFDLNQIDESQTLYGGDYGTLSLSEVTDDASNFGFTNAERSFVVLGNINNPNLFVKCKLSIQTPFSYV